MRCGVGEAAANAVEITVQEEVTDRVEEIAWGAVEVLGVQVRVSPAEVFLLHAAPRPTDESEVVGHGGGGRTNKKNGRSIARGRGNLVAALVEEDHDIRRVWLDGFLPDVQGPSPTSRSRHTTRQNRRAIYGLVGAGSWRVLRGPESVAVHVLDYLKEVLPTGPKAPWPTEGGRILLLGNGFSIDRDSAFHYDSLWNVASAAGALSPRAKDLAAKLGTTNCETVLAALETQRGRDKDIDEDIQGVRLALITALKKIHLEPHVAFSEHEIASCAFFLGQFKEVFTTNYDLLLYWISNKKHKLLGTGEEGALIQLFKDGFCLEGQVPDALAFARSVMLHPKEGTPQRGFHFLHGALHLLQQDGVAWKRRVRTAELMGHKFKLDYLRRDIV